MSVNSEWVVTTTLRLVVADQGALLDAARATGGDAADIQSALQTLVRPPDISHLPGVAERKDLTWHASVHAAPDTN
jgi:hypothetical protein